MKRLTLVRHAKSSWTEIGRPDHNRTLSDSGNYDASRIGKRLAARKMYPSLILTSSATRAHQTAILIAEVLKYPTESLHIEKKLYLASPATILESVYEQEESLSEIMVIGHNPGMTELVNQLLPSLRAHNLKPSAVVAIDFSTTKWSKIKNVNAKLEFYDYPNNS